MTERTVQDIFDDRRKNNFRIEEIEEEINEMKKEIIMRKKINIEYIDELNESKIDLIKEKKIDWVESDLNEWRKYVEEDESVKYYIYSYDGCIRQQGYYKGETTLDATDAEHFKEYFNDYFYYGFPNYQDENHPNADGSECYLAFGGGASQVTVFEWP